MKSPRIMVAVIAVSALGLASAAVAETPTGRDGNSGRQAAEINAEVSQRRNERRQTADTERRNERRQQRAGGEAAEGAVARRDDKRSERRQSADRQVNRLSRWNDDRSKPRLNRKEFGHARGDQRKTRGGEQRFADRGRMKHRDFDSRVERRLSNQRERIRSGVRNGDLNHRELKRLRGDQHKIARMDRRFGSDGRYTKRERRKLNHALDRASYRVHRAKNNHRVANKSRGRKHRW